MEVSGMMRLGPKLIVRLQGEYDDNAVLALERAVTHEIARVRTSGVLIDASDMTIIDSFMARIVARLSGMVRLLGSNVVLAGLQPAVAITLVELGAKLGYIRTVLNAERGMELLQELEAQE